MSADRQHLPAKTRLTLRDGTAVVIRQARRGDIDAIVELDTRDLGISKRRYWQEQLRNHPGRDGRDFLVATGEEGLLGFIVGEVRAWEFNSPPCGWVFVMMVHPKYRELGMGSELFSAVCRRFREAGVTHVRTMVDRSYRTVLSFFRSQGMMAGPYIELEMDLTGIDPACADVTGEGRRQ